MPYKTSTLFPQRIRGDSQVTERYKIVSTEVTDGEVVHQDAVNAYLIVLRATDNYDVHIRSVATTYIPKEAPEPAMFATGISFTLVGDIAQPLP